MNAIARFDVAVAAVMVVVVVALVVKPSFGVTEKPTASTWPGPTAEAARSSPPSIAPALTAAPTFEANTDTSAIVKGASFSFDLVGSGWERQGDLSINKSIKGPQGAEAIIYWTSFPGGAYADPCGALSELSPDASTADLAAAVAVAPGTELVAGPSDVMVGGHAAQHVVLTVREDRGCDPGYFYAWSAMDRGAMWLTTDVGDTIRVWIVDVGGTPLFIAGETHAEARPGEALTETDMTWIEREIQAFVDSIRFE